MDLSTILYVIAGVIIPLWIFWRSDPKQKRISKLVDKFPGRTKIPLLGTTWRLLGVTREDIWKTFEREVSLFNRTFRTYNGSTAEINIIEADHLEVVLRSSVNINKGLFYDFLHPWLGTGLLTSSGRKWHAHRKLITPTFHFKILESFQEVFAEQSRTLVEVMAKELDNPRGFDVYPYVTRCALDIICETAMGSKINAQDGAHSPYVTAVYDMSEVLVKRLLKPWLRSDFIYSFTKDGKRYKECLEILHSFTNRVINDRRRSLKNKPKEDEKTESDVYGRKRRVAFLDLLLEAADDGAALSLEDIREEVDTFMFEGHDTTSAGMCWVLFLLGNHPEIQEKAYEEQQAIFGDSDRLPTMQDLNEMKYLERVIKESLRLYPSVPFIIRQLVEDVQVGDDVFPAGCNVNLLIYFAHRNPKHFPNPDRFDPDRFLPDRVQGRHPYAYVPFSAGPRNCIGQKFAMLEEKTVLSSVLRKYRLRSLNTPSETTLMGELVLRPANGIRLVIERR